MKAAATVRVRAARAVTVIAAMDAKADAIDIGVSVASAVSAMSGVTASNSNACPRNLAVKARKPLLKRRQLPPKSCQQPHWALRRRKIKAAIMAKAVAAGAAVGEAVVATVPPAMKAARPAPIVTMAMATTAVTTPAPHHANRAWSRKSKAAVTVIHARRSCRVRVPVLAMRWMLRQRQPMPCRQHPMYRRPLPLRP